MGETYRYKGYAFETKEEFENAKKEDEAIRFIKAKTDLNDEGTKVALYNRMIDRKIVSTPIGLEFLTSLRNEIIKNGFVTEDKLRPLPELKIPKPKKTKPVLTKVQKLEKQNSELKLIVLGLVIIIIGMFVIVLTGKSSPLKPVYEKQVDEKFREKEDELAAWEQELYEKNEWIKDRMFFLEQNGIFYGNE